MIALAVLQMAVTWYGAKVSWELMNVPSSFYTISYVMVAGIICTTTVKVFCHINALTGQNKPGSGSMWTVSDENINLLFQIHDYIWWIFAMLFPLLQSGYLAYRGIDDHTLLLTLEDNRKCDIEMEEGTNLLGECST